MVELSPPALARPRVPERNAGRFALLDGLRFAAALTVVAFHFTARKTDAWATPVSEQSPAVFDLTKYGVFGVDLFFVISGFVILMTAWGRPLHQFVSSRVSRLYPAYWVCVLLTAGVLVFNGAHWFTTSDVLINLTMAQEAFNVPHIDGVYWTLWVEMRFYALMAVFVIVGISERRLIAFSVLWPVAAAIAEKTQLDFVAYVLVWQHAALFAGGMMLFVIVRNGHSFVRWLAVGTDLLLALATSAPEAAQRILGTTGSGVPSLAAIGCVLLCFVAVALVTMTRLRRVNWKWLSVLGALTYPLYLLHEQIGWAVIEHTQQLGWFPAALLAAAIALGLAAAVHFLVERPGGPVLRRRLTAGLAPAMSGSTRPTGTTTAENLKVSQS
ncbi:peptidoglycan/LPS O-acetylase OafA/YrhL [Curtobacterium sp. PhB130]|uniref:acyltransferase family protein n=1 Tax=Curtobacterium sp. PhB130 TaxID=2485178 RepID=UPI000FC1120E|nr:acyltransferase [Curtobacterium sp. PhB130]ROS72306.1 peptidoglycan/LPS O-acetylase OafA/YrhL [Curtobacterium sp. PhB130]